MGGLLPPRIGNSIVFHQNCFIQLHSNTQNIEIYVLDLLDWKWSKVKSIASPKSRYYQTECQGVVYEDKSYYFGGYDGSTYLGELV